MHDFRHLTYTNSRGDNIKIQCGMQMASGSIMTALTNTFLCIVIPRFAAHEIGRKFKDIGISIHEGDDCTMSFVDKDTTEKVLEIFKGVGMNYESCFVDDIEKFEFVGLKMFRRTDGEWEMYRDVYRSLIKFGLTTV